MSKLPPSQWVGTSKMLTYFMAFWNNLQTIEIFYDHLIHTFCVHLVQYFRFWYHVPRKIWHPWSALPGGARAQVSSRLPSDRARRSSRVSRNPTSEKY
jgi:hypothetical protein